MSFIVLSLISLPHTFDRSDYGQCQYHPLRLRRSRVRARERDIGDLVYELATMFLLSAFVIGPGHYVATIGHLSSCLRPFQPQRSPSSNCISEAHTASGRHS